MRGVQKHQRRISRIFSVRRSGISLPRDMRLLEHQYIFLYTLHVRAAHSWLFGSCLQTSLRRNRIVSFVRKIHFELDRPSFDCFITIHHLKLASHTILNDRLSTADSNHLPLFVLSTGLFSLVHLLLHLNRQDHLAIIYRLDLRITITRFHTFFPRRKTWRPQVLSNRSLLTR